MNLNYPCASQGFKNIQIWESLNGWLLSSVRDSVTALFIGCVLALLCMCYSCINKKKTNSGVGMQVSVHYSIFSSLFWENSSTKRLQVKDRKRRAVNLPRPSKLFRRKCKFSAEQLQTLFLCRSRSK